jgi:ATP-grasp domain, R2K clade family 3
MKLSPDDIDIFQVESALWIAEAKIGLSVYDFAFTELMACRHSRYGMDEVTAVGRFGAVENYEELYGNLLECGVRLIHSPEMYQACSDLPTWYPRLAGLTPQSWWFDVAPDAETAGSLAGWPLFLKGSRQTSRHNAKLSIVRTPAEYTAAISSFSKDKMLHWQQIVIRRFERLRPLVAEMGERIPASFEFRTFWWRGALVGAGPYFAAFTKYDWNETEKRVALDLAEDAARRSEVIFVVVDVAQREDGSWIVIEINDAQESGYTGIQPLTLWQNIVEIERR